MNIHKAPLTFLAVLLLCTPLLAEEPVIVAQSPEGPIVRDQIPIQGFDQTWKAQEKSEWCWAASLSNVFTFYGHPVTQETIVKTAYGIDANWPSGSAARIAEMLNRDWTDTKGVVFKARLTAAYDAMANVHAINNALIISEIQNGHPLLVCNTHHCMVITAIDHSPLRVFGVGVFDPWPYTQKAHLLSPAEIVPVENGGQLTFVAAFSIEKADNPQEPNIDNADHSQANNDAKKKKLDRLKSRLEKDQAKRDKFDPGTANYEEWDNICDKIQGEIDDLEAAP